MFNKNLVLKRIFHDITAGDNCVPIAECGCQTQMGYIPVSTDITLENLYSQTCNNGHLKLAVACCRRPV
jgi:hypothetical protein